MRLRRPFVAVGFLSLVSLTPAGARAQGQDSRGWVGIAYTTGLGQADRNGNVIFSDYPVIESIEPGSPAERAGLQAGDLIISLNAQDLKRNPMPARRMLEPGSRIVFRFKRDDVARTSTLVVAPRPRGTTQSVAFTFVQPVPRPSTPPTPSMGQRVRMGAPLPPVGTLAPFVFAPSIGVAGAELTQLNEDLRELLELKANGVFVVNVGVGTPASESGLRSGDVILSVNSDAVQNPGELIRIMRASGDNTVRLEVVRKKKHQVLTLRW